MLHCILQYIYTGRWNLKDIDIKLLEEASAFLGIQLSPYADLARDGQVGQQTERQPQKCIDGRPLCKKLKKDQSWYMNVSKLDEKLNSTPVVTLKRVPRLITTTVAAAHSTSADGKSVVAASHPVFLSEEAKKKRRQMNVDSCTNSVMELDSPPMFPDSSSAIIDEPPSHYQKRKAIKVSKSKLNDLEEENRESHGRFQHVKFTCPVLSLEDSESSEVRNIT